MKNYFLILLLIKLSFFALGQNYANAQEGENLMIYEQEEKVRHFWPALQLKSIAPDTIPCWPAMGVDWYIDENRTFGFGGSISIPFASASFGIIPYSLRTFYYKNVTKNIAIGLGYEANLARINVKKDPFSDRIEPDGNTQSTKPQNEASSGTKSISSKPFLAFRIVNMIITINTENYYTAGIIW